MTPDQKPQLLPKWMRDNGRPIYWGVNGVIHAVTGDEVHRGIVLLWTLCEKDVPANQAWSISGTEHASHSDVSCPECRRMLGLAGSKPAPTDEGREKALADMPKFEIPDTAHPFTLIAWFVSNYYNLLGGSHDPTNTP